MRRLLALSLLVSSLACACAAGLTAPAALAAASTSTAAATTPAAATSAPQPSLNLSNAEQNAAGVSTPSVVTVPATTTTSSSSGLSGVDSLLIAIIAVLVLGGIAFYVWFDSRRSAARVGHGRSDDSLYGERAHSGSKTPHKPRKLKPAERKRRKRGRAR
ncbi:MAG TPA: hypothetical protein VHV75_03190 [Solirubrobacteraceae bacterium]|nr:hypothetical protein [Solirubrobacteraceae bacterium]